RRCRPSTRRGCWRARRCTRPLRRDASDRRAHGLARTRPRGAGLQDASLHAVVEDTEEVMSLTRTIALLAALFAGCASVPSPRAEQQSLQTSAQATLDEMIARSPGIRDTIRGAPAYAVFPSIAKGGFIVGGASGRGILYENGVPTGFVTLAQGSIGAQIRGARLAQRASPP